MFGPELGQETVVPAGKQHFALLQVAPEQQSDDKAHFMPNETQQCP